MSIEDSMSDLGFRVNIPHHQLMEYDDDDNDDPKYIADLISQQILEYLAAKLKGLCGRVSVTYGGNIPLAYKEAIESCANVFISMQLSVNPKTELSIALVHFFGDKGEQSRTLASELVNRLSGTGLFARTDYKEDVPVGRIETSIPSAVIALGFGNDALCDYNENKDDFIMRLVDEICYGIIDGYVDLRKGSDEP